MGPVACTFVYTFVYNMKNRGGPKEDFDELSVLWAVGFLVLLVVLLVVVL